ncbi:hypothetical protein [Cellvibrio sp. pealriver]|uniref:hypothetical protein n=1 Tax=Cellvibrio sp. pealriver TaxID=1622269 RepID=UPI00066FBF0A|nr:hypothetical protein [Cellvibrio sp. pealriver]
MRSKGIRFLSTLALSASALTLISCGGGDGDSARVEQTVDASKNGVTSIAIASNAGIVHIKGDYQFNVIGKNAESKEFNLNSKATWKLSDASFGSIKDGLFKAAGKTGQVSLIVNYAGMTTEQTISLTDANLKKVTVKHSSGATSVDECQNTTFTAEAEFEGGITLPYPLTWKITEGSGIASFKDKNTGTLSTTNSGAIKIVASGVNNDNQEISSDALGFTVNDELTAITVTNSKTTEWRDGDTATVTIKGIYDDANNPIDITANATLSATPASLLKIEGTKITAQNGTANGSTVALKGACGGIEGTQELVIKERQLRSIEIRNNNGGATSNLSVSEGSNLNLDVTATYADGSTKDDYTSNVFWEVDDRNNTIPDDRESRISISSTGELRVNSDLDLGSSAIIYVVAEVRDSEGNVIENSSGAEVTDDINITINPN